MDLGHLFSVGPTTTPLTFIIHPGKGLAREVLGALSGIKVPGWAPKRPSL
jgi:hypothetical protein